MESLLGSEKSRNSTTSSASPEMLYHHGHIPTTPTSSAPGHMRVCRYGKGCTRSDCKFWHENRSHASGEIGKRKT